MKHPFKNRLQSLISFFRMKEGYRIFLCLFLFPVFFILHGSNENFGIIPAIVLWQLFKQYFLITLSVVIITLLWFKTPVRAFIFAFYLLVVYFYFGAFYDFLQSSFPGSRIYSYSVLLPSLAIFTGLIYWMINRHRRSFTRLTNYLVMLTLVLTALELFYTGLYSWQGKQRQNDLSGDFKLKTEATDGCDSAAYPDIYFIVFDGYTSSPALQESFGFSNAGIDSAFSTGNFFLSSASRSNYNFTAFSLGSTFHLDYFKKGIETEPVIPKTVMQAVRTMYQNPLVEFLDQRGYDFRNFGRFEMNHMPSEQVSFFDYYYHSLIDQQTLYSRISANIGWHLTAKNLFTREFQVPALYKRNKEAHLARNETNFTELIQELKKKGDRPRFVYSHLMLPHEPFFLREDGSMFSDSAIIFNTIDMKEGYVEQVKYSNRLIGQIIELAGRDTGRPKVIIIEGDHGYRFWDADELDKEFPNLNAFYFSDKNYQALYDGISPVNTFRVVLNKYFCQSLPMLKDSSIYLKKPGQ